MWVFLCLGTALFAGTSDALAKKALQTERITVVAWTRAGWGALFLLPFFLASSGPAHPRDFWTTVAMAVPLEVAAALALQSALKSSPISVCIPFLAFTPVFLIVTGWAMLAERPSALGIVGILFVTAGAFVLHWRGGVASGKPGFGRGPALVLLVALLYSVTSVLAKRALLASSPGYFTGVYYLVIAAALLPFQITKPGWPAELVRRPALFAGIGLAEASGILLQFHAFLVAPVAYAIAVKRLSLLVSVAYGRVLFGERHIAARAAGAGLMIAGAALIAFA